MRLKRTLLEGFVYYPPGICYSDAGGDNASGGGSGGDSDSGGSGGDAAGGQDNAGQNDVIGADFWNKQINQGGDDQKGGGNQGGGGDQSTQGTGGDQQKNPVEVFQEQIANTDFGFAITPEIVEEVREGNFENFGKTMNTMVSNGVVQGAILAMKMVQGNNKTLEAMVKNEVSKGVGTNTARQAMHAKFPSSKDPKIAPIAEGIWSKALQHAGGDNDKAGEIAEMFSTMMVETFSKDLGIKNDDPPPGSPGSEGFVDGIVPDDWVNDVFALMKPPAKSGN